MDQLSPSWQALLAPLLGCFHPRTGANFAAMLAAWVVCLGRRTISRVWETTGRSQHEDHSKAFRLFSQAAWNSDVLAYLLLARLLALPIPTARVWLVVDDTLCHKRGARVAFGGVFLDPVLSTRKHKSFRYATNWVTLGILLQLPFRQDRFLCVNLLWRLANKATKGTKAHQTKPMLARQMIDLAASWLPDQPIVVVADSAYIVRAVLHGLPANVAVIGPIHPKAVLTEPLPPGHSGRTKAGKRLTTATAAFDDPQWSWQEIELAHPGGTKTLAVKVVGGCCWYASAGTRPLQVVLVRDPQGQWRNERLLCTELSLSAVEVVSGYCRRWSAEVAYAEGKQLLGFAEPMVWSERSVVRAHAMAWVAGAVVVLWYAEQGQYQPQAQRHRPWYKDKVSPTLADMLACARLHLWRHWLDHGEGKRGDKLEWLLEYLATAA